jgi:hypothetical protein
MSVMSARLRTVLAAVLLGTIVGSTAFAAHRMVAAPGSTALQVHGSLLLSDPETERNHCVGTDGFDDIRPSTLVLILLDGEVIGFTRLGTAQGDASAGTCVWRWTVRDVPSRRGVYSVQVSHRGWLTFSRHQLTVGDAVLTLDAPTASLS